MRTHMIYTVLLTHLLLRTHARTHMQVPVWWADIPGVTSLSLKDLLTTTVLLYTTHRADTGEVIYANLQEFFWQGKMMNLRV